MIYIIIAIIGIFLLASLFKKCKPNCSGVFCGDNSNDGCGGTCECRGGGICKNGICCYPNCNGLLCGDDGCGGKCSCARLPNGKCDSESQKCCYAQDCNNVYCGNDGCNGTCGCQTGATCSAQGVCSNAGTPGWIYNVSNPENMIRKNVASAQECSGWLPENIHLDLLTFKCSCSPDDKNCKDCPYGDKCIKGFCDRNNVYQYWYYDPTDPSGFNCTKILAGTGVCGVKKAGASGFDIISNVGPDKIPCGTTCTVNPICPPTGINSCCPKTWARVGDTSQCADEFGKIQCCLNNPNYPDYSTCLKTNKSCETIPDVWWKTSDATISNGVCGTVMTGPDINVTDSQIFQVPCNGKNPSDKCQFATDSIQPSSYTGICKVFKGTLQCLPESMCEKSYGSVGRCSTI